MTFAEWLAAWPYTRVDHPNQAPTIIVPDCGRADCDEKRRQAWSLTDYRVTSVQAGALYFSPIN